MGLDFILTSAPQVFARAISKPHLKSSLFLLKGSYSTQALTPIPFHFHTYL